MTLNPQIKGFSEFFRDFGLRHVFKSKLRRNGWR